MKKIVVLLVLLLFLSLGLYGWWNNGINAVDKTNTAQKIFVIKKGEAVREIGNSLRQEGLIRDPIVFFLLIKKTGNDKNIQAGDYRLSPSMNLFKIIDTLSHGTLDVWVTFPEGVRSEEVADILEKNIKTYNPSWREILNQNEGYLFPDTYLIPQDATVEMIVEMMRNVFSQKAKSISLPEVPVQLDKIVRIASLIEREAKFADEASIVSSVIHNRLEIGMPLQIDASIQYILGYQLNEKTWWKRHLTVEDLRISSPFNTYKNSGIIPAPISNPGLNSLKAAKNPSNTQYLYYVSDLKGHLHFAKNIDEHNANIQKYIK